MSLYGDPSDLSFFPLGAHTTRADLSTIQTLAAADVGATGATKLLIQCETQDVRITLDGTDPTSTLGFKLVAGQSMVMIPLGSGAEGTVIKVLQVAATARIQYQWGE